MVSVITVSPVSVGNSVARWPGNGSQRESRGQCTGFFLNPRQESFQVRCPLVSKYSSAPFNCDICYDVAVANPLRKSFHVFSICK
jgi:hypothetical protein